MNNQEKNILIITTNYRGDESSNIKETGVYLDAACGFISKPPIRRETRCSPALYQSYISKPPIRRETRCRSSFDTASLSKPPIRRET